MIVGRAGTVATVGDVNVGTVGVVTLGDGVAVVGDGLVIVGDVLSVDGGVLAVVGDVLGVVGEVLSVVGDGLLPVEPVVPVTPLRPVDDSEVLVADDVVGDEPIVLVGAGIVGETLGVIGDGDGDIRGDVDGTGEANVVGGLGDGITGVVTRPVVPTLGLDIVPGPGTHGNGAVIGADGVDVVGLIGSGLPA